MFTSKNGVGPSPPLLPYTATRQSLIDGSRAACREPCLVRTWRLPRAGHSGGTRRGAVSLEAFDEGPWHAERCTGTVCVFSRCTHRQFVSSSPRDERMPSMPVVHLTEGSHLLPSTPPVHGTCTHARDARRAGTSAASPRTRAPQRDREGRPQHCALPPGQLTPRADRLTRRPAHSHRTWRADVAGRRGGPMWRAEVAGVAAGAALAALRVRRERLALSMVPRVRTWVGGPFRTRRCRRRYSGVSATEHNGILRRITTNGGSWAPGRMCCMARGACALSPSAPRRRRLGGARTHTAHAGHTAGAPGLAEI
jgi:hypothetical protein